MPVPLAQIPGVWLAVLLAGCGYDVDLGEWATQATGEVTEVAGGSGCLTTPAIVDFGTVLRGEVREQDVTLFNRCAAPRDLSRLTLDGDPGFEIEIDGAWVSMSRALAQSGFTFPEPTVLAPHGELSFRIRYRPSRARHDEANLIFFVDAPARDAAAVRLRANTTQRCLSVFPKELNFGEQLVGTTVSRHVQLTPCSNLPVELSWAHLVATQRNGTFTIDAPPGPITIAPGETYTLNARYTPTRPGADGDGGVIRLVTDVLGADEQIALRGRAVTGPCASPIIGGGDVIIAPGDSVVFDGNQSMGAERDGERAPVLTWSWRVEGPFAQELAMHPGSGRPEVAITFPLAGEYLVLLDVTDDDGVAGCDEAAVSVRVTTQSAVRVELVWLTPNDDDPHDQGIERGADLDLHVRHPFAASQLDGWFDRQFDVYFSNPAPEWIAVGAVWGRPQLLRDDLDGWGPEAFELDQVPADGVLTIGVHHWDDHGFGDSYAVIRLILEGEVRWVSRPVMLQEDDFWDVGRLDWLTATITPGVAATGTPIIHRRVRDVTAVTPKAH